LEYIKDQKAKIMENINLAKASDIEKVSAIIMWNEDVKKKIIMDLILDGYRVSLKEDEVDILTIEW
ncbi:hypothetical protein, partial [Clostridium sp.]|uniref:hypothetical protein n=1 Tax=Clostridium sp. TaxID=1506 RepID=UPI002625D7FB